MSLNTAHANGGVLIYNGEMILLYCDGVEMTLEGGDAKQFGGTKKGRAYLTTHRMIFINKSEKDPLQSFSFPFFSMADVQLEQPVFGANYIKGKVNAQPNGFWTGKAVFKLKFFSGGAIEFGQAMVQTARLAGQYMPPQPPPYMPQQGPYYPAPPPAYTPPSGGVNGFVPPTHAFPDAPPPNSVYTSGMPPPYPGIDPNMRPFVHMAGSEHYPQATDEGIVWGPGAAPAPPPGFVPQGGAAAPPPYASNQPSAPDADNSGHERKMYPPIYDSYANFNDPHMMWAPSHAMQQPPYMNGQQPPYNAAPHMNGDQQNNPYMNGATPEAPPPYTDGNSKKQQ